MKNNTDGEPKYFICYLDYEKTIEKLDNNEAGALFKALYNYACNNIENNLSEFPRADILFDIMRNSIKREFEKLKAKSEQNQKNGKKGGAPKGNQNAKKSKELTDKEYTEQRKKELNSMDL